MDGGVALDLEGVTRTFGKLRALRDVSFRVPRGCVFGLLGPNGAGKTTLFSIVAHFLKADAGSIEVLGADVSRIGRLHGRVTILPQDALFQRNVPILEQLVLFRMLDGRSRTQSIEEVQVALDRVGLGEYAHRGVQVLSHGMAKRLGVAQAFLGEPELILLDEPTAGLDPRNARMIRDIVLELRSSATIIVSSHNLAEIQELCDEVAILHRGELVAAGPVDEVTRGGCRVDLRFARPLDDAVVAAMHALPGVHAVSTQGEGRYRVDAGGSDGDDTAEAITEALLRLLLDRGLVPRALHQGATLEATFLEMTDDGAHLDAS